ncbi:hypothetical protein [Alienimonas californiensis]|uniref:YHS domain protein n=1 Tax=Alienimonas californiensis TaxID=2527989 RepID=A0A517P593_9PLAN|nr:hypothetical protein [Alienimonas californiensis]QDT14550.1 YHS domain protein [Alienimonas californiensis]
MLRPLRPRRSAAAWQSVVARRAAALLLAAGASAASASADGDAPAAPSAPAPPPAADAAATAESTPEVRRLSDGAVAPPPPQVTPPPDWVDPFAAEPSAPEPEPEAPAPPVAPTVVPPAAVEPTDGPLFGPLPEALEPIAPFARPTPAPAPVETPQPAALPKPEPLPERAPAPQPMPHPLATAEATPSSAVAAPAAPEPTSEPAGDLNPVGPDGKPIAVVLFDVQIEDEPSEAEGPSADPAAEERPFGLFDHEEILAAEQQAEGAPPAGPSGPRFDDAEFFETDSFARRVADSAPAGRASLALTPSPAARPGRAYLEFAPVSELAPAPEPQSKPAAAARVAAAPPAAAAVPVVAAPAVELPAAFGQFCPVAVRDDRRLTEADPRVVTRFGGKTYKFSSPVARAAFLLDPERYLPVAEGEDVVLAAAEGFSVPGRVEHAVLYGGRLFLFRSPRTRDAFAENPDRWVNADGPVDRGAAPIPALGEPR